MITAIGNPVYDYIRTPKVDTKERILSGCSTNAALALAKMGEEVRLIGAIGDDFKEQFIRDLAAHRNAVEVAAIGQPQAGQEKKANTVLRGGASTDFNETESGKAFVDKLFGG